MTEHLSLEDLLELVDDLQVGPVRDLGLLDSATHRPRTSLWGREAYPTLDEKAAALLESLVRNHPLVDGNKRLGWLATVVFLDINGAWVEAPDDDAYDLVIAVASGQLTLPEIARTLGRWHQLVAAESGLGALLLAPGANPAGVVGDVAIPMHGVCDLVEEVHLGRREVDARAAEVLDHSG